MSPKARLLDLVRRDLRQTLTRLEAAARESHAAATDPDSKAEGKYDTRSLEASYLAQGQARQVEDLTAAIALLERFEPRDFEPTDPVAMGALVETDLDGETEWFLLLPAGGGHELVFEGRNITLLGPDSPLHRALVGTELGDSLDATGHAVTEIA
jgi:transcription elongation GreA/GreB family factor